VGWRRVDASSGLASAVLLSVGVALGVLASPPAGGQAPGLEQAKAALLERSDFPSGWTSQGSVTSSQGGGTDDALGGSQQGLFTCLGVSSALGNLHASLTAKSPNFKKEGGAEQITNQVSVWQSPKVAEQIHAALSGPKTPACAKTYLESYRQQWVESFKGATAGSLSAAPPNSFWLVPHSGGFTASLPITTPDTTTTVMLTLIDIVRRRMTSEFTFVSAGPPISASLAHRLLATAYGRLSNVS
jgi:hypothetical protein